jgi:hypothetical protein
MKLILLNSISVFLCTLNRYGYRGRDCRSNLHQIATGDTVYFIASVVVLVNVQETVQRHYLGHTDDIRWFVAPDISIYLSIHFHPILFFSLTVHPNKIIIASGQTGSPEKKKRSGGTSPTTEDKLVSRQISDEKKKFPEKSRS